MDTSNLPSYVGPASISVMVGGFITAMLRAILKGQLVPRTTHEDRIRDRDAQIEFYRTAYETEKQRGAELVTMVRQLMEVGATTEHVVRNLQAVALGTTGGANEPAATTVVPAPV